MTSAPKSDSTVAAAGAAMKLAQSRTLMPSKMPFSIWRCSLAFIDFARKLLVADEKSFDRCWATMQPLLLARQQRRVAADRGGVNGHGLLGREARQVMGPAGLGTGARQPIAAERLNPDDGADHIAVDVHISDLKRVDHLRDRIIDPRVYPERQAVPGLFDPLDHASEPIGGVAHHMEDGAEHFLAQFRSIGQFEDMRRDVIALGRHARKMDARPFVHA